jgi:hypothetical protein
MNATVEQRTALLLPEHGGRGTTCFVNRRRLKGFLVVIALFLGYSISVSEASAAVRNAASCSWSDVLSAYNAAASGDTIIVPAGNCDSSNQWSAYIVLAKDNLTIQAAQQGGTSIGISKGGAGFQIYANNVRITGFTFDCNYQETTLAGIVRIGDSSVNPTYQFRDYRIDHNTFNRCGASGGDTTGRDAISPIGFVYGVIDHNTFNDCNGECIDICADAVRATQRSVAFGQYTNGTTFVENNTFNANRAGILYENVIDGNSGQRFTFRYNTINISDGASYGSDILSTHETCALCSGSSTSGGDAGSLVGEMYENTINLNGTGRMWGLMRARAGRTLTYNNHVRYSGTGGRWQAGMTVSNYRSYNYNGPAFCGAAARPRGYASMCHEPDGSYNPEGLEATKTTLSSALSGTATALTLLSSSGFAANGDAFGFAIKIDNEIITYTGLSGNQLTGLSRGANGTAATSHSSSAAVNYLKFGHCIEQPNNTYIWGNDINGVVTSELNDASVEGETGQTPPNYEAYDIQSFTQRPNNWQYQTGTSYAYTPYAYPHPLTLSGAAPSAPTNLRIISWLVGLHVFALTFTQARRRSQYRERVSRLWRCLLNR